MNKMPPEHIYYPPLRFDPSWETKYIIIALITAAALLLYRLLSYDVRRAWLKANGKNADSKASTATFDRLHRIQMNTLEHMLFFLPSLWLCAVYFCIEFAAWLGLVWLIGRTWYAVGYFTNPKRPPYGFHVAMVVATVLFIAGAGAVVYKLPFSTLGWWSI